MRRAYVCVMYSPVSIEENPRRTAAMTSSVVFSCFLGDCKYQQGAEYTTRALPCSTVHDARCHVIHPSRVTTRDQNPHFTINLGGNVDSDELIIFSVITRFFISQK